MAISKKVLLFSVAVSLLTSVIFATTSMISSASILNSWFPIIVLGVLAAISLSIAYYLAGAILGSNRVKAGAINEFEQAIATAAIAVLVIGLIGFFGQTAQSSTNVLSPSSIQTLCTQLQGANLNFANSLADSPTKTLCNGVIDTAGGTDITSNLDYGLAASYVIIANMTNQTVRNINALYIFDQYVSFLTSFNPFIRMCIPTVDCLIGAGTPEIDVTISYIPYRGYNIFSGGTLFPFAVQTSMIFYALILQMLVIVIVLFSWPYILAS